MTQHNQQPTSAIGQGLRMSVREQSKRLSQLANPLGDLIDLNRASTYSWDEAQFVTATPNTPYSISFPDTSCSPTAESSTIAQRTPKSSISNESDKTAVASPGPETKKAGSKDVEASGQGRALRGAKEPWPLRPIFWILLLFVMLSGAVTLGLLPYISKGKSGWATPELVKLAQSTGFQHLFFTIPLTIVSMSISALWCWTDAEVRMLQPLINLASGPVIPERSLTLDYSSRNVFIALFLTVKWARDGLVTLSTLLAILSLALQPLTGALFTVREVWWVKPPTTVSSIQRVGLNRVANFLDMISFQAASSFASADVMYNFGSPPFVSEGYTVAEFELPDVVNGTVYANRSAILNQVSCVAPDSISQTKDLSASSIWHNTALFGQCEYTWMVESNATYLYGMAPGNFVGCDEDFGSVPVQFRPVLFWFFMYGAQPTASVVLCTPHVTSQQVSVTIDLATHATNAMPLHTSPDDTSIADIGSFAYNGIFFDESALDKTALARLQAIQQQLPGAIFEAARNKDPSLAQTFVDIDFAALTQSVYTTYLSLIAKSVYFVDDEGGEVFVRVGTNCNRLFLVRLAAFLLALVMFLLFVGGLALHIIHFRIRRGLVLPPHLGTLSAAIWLTAQTDLARALAEDDVGPEGIARALAGYRFFFDRTAGRVFSVPDDSPRKGHWAGRLVAPIWRKFAAIWRKIVAVGRKIAALLSRKAGAVWEPVGSV